MLCSDSTKRCNNKHPLAHWQEMILVVEFQFHPLEESLSGFHCHSMFLYWKSHATPHLWGHQPIVRILVMTPSCMSWPIGSTHEMRMGWYEREKSDFIADLSEAVCVHSNLGSTSPHVLTLRSPGRGWQTHHRDQTQLGEKRLSLKSFSIISDLRWRFWCCECIIVDYFSVSAAKAGPSPDKILGKQICQDHVLKPDIYWIN